MKIHGVQGYPRKASPLPSKASRPDQAAQLIAVGAVKYGDQRRCRLKR